MALLFGVASKYYQQLSSNTRVLRRYLVPAVTTYTRLLSSVPFSSPLSTTISRYGVSVFSGKALSTLRHCFPGNKLKPMYSLSCFCLFKTTSSISLSLCRTFNPLSQYHNIIYFFLQFSFFLHTRLRAFTSSFYQLEPIYRAWSCTTLWSVAHSHARERYGNSDRHGHPTKYWPFPRLLNSRDYWKLMNQDLPSRLKGEKFVSREK